MLAGVLFTGTEQYYRLSSENIAQRKKNQVQSTYVFPARFRIRVGIRYEIKRFFKCILDLPKAKEEKIAEKKKEGVEIIVFDEDENKIPYVFYGYVFMI